MQELDTEQVLDLIHNGFTPEHAAEAVAESHGEPRDGKYAQMLLETVRDAS